MYTISKLSLLNHNFIKNIANSKQNIDCFSLTICLENVIE